MPPNGVIGQEGSSISVRIYKTLITNPSLQWANTYELGLGAEMDLDAIETAVNGLVAFEQNIHLTSVRFVRAVASTEAEDGKPYNPNSFVTYPLTEVGLRESFQTEPLPLQICLRAAFKVITGRQGFRLYRGVLNESDVSSSAGVPMLVGTSVFDLVKNSRTSFLADLIENAGNIQLDLVSPGTIRRVLDVRAAGVTVKKFNNRYFDKLGK